jgi:hypothetical protein
MSTSAIQESPNEYALQISHHPAIHQEHSCPLFPTYQEFRLDGVGQPFLCAMCCTIAV